VSRTFVFVVLEVRFRSSWKFVLLCLDTVAGALRGFCYIEMEVPSGAERRGRGASPTRMLVSPGLCSPGMSLTNPCDLFKPLKTGQSTKEVLPNCNQMTGDGETVTPSLPEPGVWTGMAKANVWAPLRWKRAKIHRGTRQRIPGPHHEAGCTSAVVTVAPDQVSLSLQSRGVHIRPHMALFVLRDLSAIWSLLGQQETFIRIGVEGLGSV
jgi:hypothetical protein